MGRSDVPGTTNRNGWSKDGKEELTQPVEKETKLPEARRKELVKTAADQAMDSLRQAVANGYKDADHMKKDTDLHPIRNREDFKKLLAELEAKNN